MHIIGNQQRHLDSATDAIEHQQPGFLRRMQRPSEIQSGIKVDLARESDDAGVTLLEREGAKFLCAGQCWMISNRNSQAKGQHPNEAELQTWQNGTPRSVYIQTTLIKLKLQHKKAATVNGTGAGVAVAQFHPWLDDGVDLGHAPE
ncbi:hypothetical protein [Ensifer aridi]|uniref:hypothetical protein n=1 Tax=Ensifer aridi TaxID=1708715 RepID=UPI00111C8950|nr:hypothetical protein [Ensifer aridi]